MHSRDSDSRSSAALLAPAGYRLVPSWSAYRMGPGDPSLRFGPHRVDVALRTPAGPVSVRAHQRGDTVHAELWGPGGGRLIEGLPALLGFEDDPRAFMPRDPAMRAILKKSLGMHLPRLPTVFTRLAQVVMLQLITTREANRAWSRTVRELGEPAPGPLDLCLPPTPTRLASTPWYAFVAHGLPHRQARTLSRIARRAPAIEGAAGLGPDALSTHLRSIPGIGPWTDAYVRGTALGDADAVLVGDAHLPHAVAWLLAREERADDRRMNELLEPYTGHRFRVIRAVWAFGAKPPRYGPKRPPRPLQSL